MVDSGPYPSDGENRAPRKPRYEKRSGHSGTRDSNPETQNGYSNEKSESRHQHERSRSRHQDREDRREERPHSRHHEDRSHSRHQERDQQYEGKEQSRNQREKRRDGYKERDRYHEDRRQSERSRSHHEERDSYSTEKSHYHERDDYHKERSRSGFDEKERRQEHYVHSVERQGHPGKDPEHYYPSERTFAPNDAQMNDMEYYEPESEGGILNCHKCKYLCTGRACCQLVEVLLNMLILICCSVSYNSTGGYTGIANLGGIYYYQYGGAYSGFSGADGEKAQTLDLQFYQLKLPTVTASMAFGGAIMAFSCLLLLLGVLRVPWHWPVWLLVECALDVGIAVGYIPALYFYFQHLEAAYNSQVCKDRQTLYSSKGYQGFTCGLQAADIAAALFACVAIIAFIMSAVLAIKGFRTVRRMKQKPVTTLEF
ncbi:MARVEL domain-containing protein 3 isoform X3 [Pseudophryne corroboree]